MAEEEQNLESLKRKVDTRTSTGSSDSASDLKMLAGQAFALAGSAKADDDKWKSALNERMDRQETQQNKIEVMVQLLVAHGTKIPKATYKDGRGEKGEVDFEPVRAALKKARVL